MDVANHLKMHLRHENLRSQSLIKEAGVQRSEDDGKEYVRSRGTAINPE